MTREYAPYPAVNMNRPVIPNDELGGGQQEVVALIAQDGVASRGVLYTPSAGAAKVGIHLIHPQADFSTHFTIPSMVRAGYTVLGHHSRYANNDSNCIHERLILDVAAAVKRLREAGCEKVVFLGMSGGSSVAPFYQRQARTAPPGRLTDTPAGDPLDLNGFDLPAADGVILLTPHLGRGATMLKWLDPSVTDENDPASYEPSIDMFHPDNGWRPAPESSSYKPEFYERFRKAQVERCRRLDRIAHERIAARRAAAKRAAELEAAGSLGAEWRDASRRSKIVGYMQIYRTQADPALADLSIDPDDRDLHCIPSPFSPRMDLVNWSTNPGAYQAPEAWLSTWSGLSTRADTIDNVSGFDDPVCVIIVGADWCTRLAEGRRIFDAVKASDKILHTVRHQDHFNFPVLPNGGRGPRATTSIDLAIDWLKDKFQA